MRSQIARVAIGAVLAAALLWGAWHISKGGEAERDRDAQGAATAPSARTDSLRVDVSGVRNDRGFVIGTLCKDGEVFPSGCKRRARAKAADGVVSLDFQGLAKGGYALALYHDENENGALELGVEGIGFSNNANLAKAPPDYDASRIEVNGATRIRVRIRYSL